MEDFKFSYIVSTVVRPIQDFAIFHSYINSIGFSNIERWLT